MTVSAEIWSEADVAPEGIAPPADDPSAAPLDVSIPEATSDIDAAEFLASFADADPVARLRMLDDLSDEDRAAVRDAARTLEAGGPIDVRASETDEFVDPPADRNDRDAMARYRTAVQIATGKAEKMAFLIRNGQIDLAPEVIAEFTTHMDQAASLPPSLSDRRDRHFQAAANLADKIHAELRENLPFKATFSRTYMGPDRKHYREERDALGRTRTTPVDMDALEEAQTNRETDARPWGNSPQKVTMEQAAQWDKPTLLRFREEHPEHFLRLRGEESHLRDRAHLQRRLGF